MVKRELESIINNHLFKGKAIIIYGARQTGKTTLVESLLKDFKKSTLFLNGDDADVRDLLSDPASTKLIPVIGNNEIVVLDEAQRIPEAGVLLKIIHDNFNKVQLIATGSSSFEIADEIKEPLTGRKFEFLLYPFSFSEMVGHHGFLNEKRLLEHRLVFGYYPDIALNIGNEVKLLKLLVSSYLYKDLLMLETVKKPVLLEKILKSLASQVSNEVSYNELAQMTGSNKETVEKYISLLEKCCVIFRLNALSGNLRNEIKKSRKIYFYDNGILNAIMGNFTPFALRSDKGALWENFIVSERLKYLENNRIEASTFFWRTAQQQEIDYIEERDNRLYAYEFKCNPVKRAFLSKTFLKAYPGTEFKVVSPGNIDEFLLKN